MLAFCLVAGMGSAAVAAATRPQAPLGTRAVLYATSPQGVTVFDTVSGNRIATLAPPAEQGFNGYEKLAVDGAQNIYAGAQFLAKSQFTVKIEAYSPHANRPVRELLDGPGFLSALAASASGEVAAVRLDLITTSIAFYAPGATAPTRTIASTPFDAVFGAAYEPDGTLWMFGYSKSASQVIFAYVPPGGTSVTVAFSIPPQGNADGTTLAIDAAGNILFEQYGLITAYTATGDVVYTVRLGGRPNKISSVAFSPDHTILYVAQYALQVETYRFPQGGAPIGVFPVYSSSLATGIR
jgi:hypothetical protein